MPSKTEKQKKFFGAVKGAKKGQKKVSGAAKKAAKEMTEDQIDDFIKEESVTKNTISKFIDSVLHKNYAQANKYLKDVVELKLQQKIAREINNPLF